MNLYIPYELIYEYSKIGVDLREFTPRIIVEPKFRECPCGCRPDIHKPHMCAYYHGNNQ